MSNRGTEVYLGARSSTRATRAAPSRARVAFHPPSSATSILTDMQTCLGRPFHAHQRPAPTIYFGGSTSTAPATLILTKTAGGPSTLMQTEPAGRHERRRLRRHRRAVGLWRHDSHDRASRVFRRYRHREHARSSIPGPYANYYTLQDSGRVGDLNGDGFEDIALAAMSDEGSNGGLVQLFAGGRRPMRRPSTSRSPQLRIKSSRSVTPMAMDSTMH